MCKIILETVDSTNNYIKANLTSLADRTVVIAKQQTAGRGRFSRSFISESGGLYMSLLLKNHSAELLTVRAGVSVADVLCELGADVKIKWVNDIYCEGKKVCGILSEAVSGCAIVGIGVNIKHNDALPEVASSLEKLYGIDIKPIELAERIIDRFDDDTDIIGRYRNYTAYMIGQRVTYNSGEGTVIAVTENGNLAVKNTAGEVIILNSGEISVRMVL